MVMGLSIARGLSKLGWYYCSSLLTSAPLSALSALRVCHVHPLPLRSSIWVCLIFEGPQNNGFPAKPTNKGVPSTKDTPIYVQCHCPCAWCLAWGPPDTIPRARLGPQLLDLARWAPAKRRQAETLRAACGVLPRKEILACHTSPSCAPKKGWCSSWLLFETNQKRVPPNIDTLHVAFR